MLDIDKYKKPLSDLTDREAYEYLLFEVKRLQKLYHLGKALIYETDRGYLIHYPFSRLTQAERNAILYSTLIADKGWIYWTKKIGVGTIRITEKPIVKINKKGRKLYTYKGGNKPRLIKVVENE